jgi:hypothetical protein
LSNAIADATGGAGDVTIAVGCVEAVADRTTFKAVTTIRSVLPTSLAATV